MHLNWPKPLIIVEGNIGGGKSTAAKELAKRLNLRLLHEPVDDELLQLFYDDQKRWSFPFQMEMLHRRWAMQMSAAAETTVEGGYDGSMLDRSLWGDLVFARSLAENGTMHRKEWDIYIAAVRNMSMVLFPPTVLLYLNARPETCLERIKERGRPQEKDITLEYLQMIHSGYQRLLAEAKVGFYPWSHAVQIMVVPWDPMTVSPSEWDRTAEMLREAYRSAHNVHMMA
jgi:deoxyadenosine/deoxycytidine kinase